MSQPAASVYGTAPTHPPSPREPVTEPPSDEESDSEADDSDDPDLDDGAPPLPLRPMADAGAVPPANPRAAARAAFSLDSLTTAQRVTAASRHIDANKVATPTQVGEVLVRWGEDHDLQDPPAALLAFLLASADQGTSPDLVMTGATQGAPFSELKDAVESVTTHRRFAMYHAKHAFDAMVRAKRPPARWAEMGVPHDARYAGFDFFAGVTHPAALNVRDGMKREPTDREIAAGNTARELAILRSRAQRGAVTQAATVGANSALAGATGRPQIGW